MLQRKKIQIKHTVKTVQLNQLKVCGKVVVHTNIIFRILQRVFFIIRCIYDFCNDYIVHFIYKFKFLYSIMIFKLVK